MESTRVKNEIHAHMADMMINGKDKSKIEKFKKLKHWLVLALENDISKLKVPYGGSKEHARLLQELSEARNQDPYSTEKHGEVFSMSIAGLAAHEVARRTKENEIRKAEERVRSVREEALKFALKKEYEEAFLKQKKVSDLERGVSEKKDRNEWCYFWELVTCQLKTRAE
jgi:hypothetical protein